jgi:hypothetical protein
MSFSSKVKKETCHRFCGLKMEVHHIREAADGGPDTEDNAIPLCFDCHADMRSYDHKHPEGNKYTEPELKRHRTNWYVKVQNNSGVAESDAIRETDKKVYEHLLEILPWEGSINFIRGNNFAGFSFKNDHLKELFDFKRNSKNPAFEFIDPDLETYRCELLAKIDEFTSVIVSETYPAHSSGCNSIPEEWEYEQPERFRKVVKQLQDSAADIVSVYTDLSRTATRKLGILPKIIAQPVGI